MKLSFFEKIIAEYKASKKESLLILVIMLTVSVSIGLSCIMLNSQQIERSLMKNIDIRLELEGGSIFDCVYNGDEYARTKLLTDKRGIEAFRTFYNDIKEFRFEEGVVDYGYSLGTNQAIVERYEAEQQQYDYNYYRMLGITSADYKNYESIELIDGRFFTNEDINNNAKKIIVDESVDLNGEKIKVGDKLTVSIAGYPIYSGDTLSVYKYYSTEAEVIGIYKYHTMFDTSYGKQDAFVNNHCILIPEGIMEEAFIENELFDYSMAFINNVWFKLESFDYYYARNYDFYKMISTKSAEVFTITGGGNNASAFTVTEENPSMLKVKQNDYATVMRSVDKTSNFYFVVFAVGAVTSVAMLSSMMLFVLNRKKREMNVYYSLGQSKERILLKYAGYYCFIGMFAAVIGFIIAYSISQLLFMTLVKNSGDIQYELMQLSVNGNETISNASIQLDSIRLSEIVKAALMSCICLIIIIFVMVSCSMKSILRGSLRDKINGGI